MAVVTGSTAAPGTPGVLGENTNTTASAGPGVHGVSAAAGVIGDSKTWHGVGGLSQSTTGGAGVYGKNSAGGTGIIGESDGWMGVYGKSTSTTGGAGVMGEGDPSPGVIGKSTKWIGVYGETAGIDNGPAGVWGEHKGAGIGVKAVSQNGIGLAAYSSTNEAVHAETQSASWSAGVTGLAVNPNGVAAGVHGESTGSGPGVFGKAIRDAGVLGFHGDPHLEETLARQDGSTAGVFGASDVGAGIVGYSRSADAGKFIGSVQVTGNLTVHGDIFVPGADCAEQFEVAGAHRIEPGSVLVIAHNGTLCESDTSYDTKVAGVVSGAGAYRPGVILDSRRVSQGLPVALVGKVYCKVDAQYGPVAVGDLLTTSPTAGHAMKATDPMRAFGAVIGKALGSLPTGRGLVPILVCLQ